MAAASTAVAVGVALVVSGAGGTSAFLSAGATVAPAGGVITSGTAALTVTALTLPTTALYPGLTLYGAVTVSNAGDVPLSVVVSGLTETAPNDFTSALIVGVGAADSAAACSAGTVTPGWTGTLANAPAGPIGATLAVGASGMLCVSVTLLPAAPTGGQGLSGAGFGLRLGGTQVAP